MRSCRAILMVLLALLIWNPASVLANVVDQGQSNMSYAEVFYDQRHEENLGRVNGEYIHMYFDVVTGGYLDSIDDVISVTVRHTPSDAIYTLNYKTYDWMGTTLDEWALKIAPTSITLDDEGVWEFKLCYAGNDGNTHDQIFQYNMGPFAPPARPHHVKIDYNGTNYTVSWNGIGNPYGQPFDYQVRVFDATGGIATLKGNWRSGYSDGTYDGRTNWVTFTIPSTYGAGQELRLENRIFTGDEGHMNRSSLYLQLPYEE